MSGPQLKIKNQIIEYRWTSWKIRENFVSNPQLECDIIYYGVTMDLRKKSFIELVESCPWRWGLLLSTTIGGMIDG